MRLFSKCLKHAFSSLKCYSTNSTIYAVSSGHGKCGVTVIRVSGNNSKQALKSVTTMQDLPQPRRAILRTILDPQTREIIDKGLILWFPGPGSFTGEDSFELQVHGSLAVINAILRGLGKIPGLRLAKPGEFTQRAFYNGKLDLTEVEGLADLLQAETEIQLKQAYLQSQGVLSKLYNRWRRVLLTSLAHMEADIDFNETEDIDDDILKKITSGIEQLKQDIKKHLEDGRRGEILRSGVKTVILGEPNVGKSSLLNLLCQRPAAIVSPLEGTTRDVLNLTLNINGYPLILSDTAGLRNTPSDIVEAEGINRALQSYESADLVILLADAVKYKQSKSTLASFLKTYLQLLNLSSLLYDSDSNSDINFTKPCLVVLNKTDLVLEDDCKLPETPGDVFTGLSCKTETGLQDFMEKLTEKLKVLCGQPSEEHPSMSQERHRYHLNKCVEDLEMFIDKCRNGGNTDAVLLAEHLRKAMRSLGMLVGSVTTEQMLDVIFKDFCIGK